MSISPDHFYPELSLAVRKDPPDIRLGERTLRVEHENQMDHDDRAYLLFHWFLRELTNA